MFPLAMPIALRWFCALLLLFPVTIRAEESFLPGVKRILFLGDSITHSGTYVEYFEAHLLTRHPERKFEVINAGLSSETVSGLSEDNHAGGKFPRPDLHERLDRALEKTRPNLVFACYGMNDGIYLPLDTERFSKFQEGMIQLHQKAEAAGARIIHITPPTFDPGPKAQPEAFNYNSVLDAYSEWLLAQRAKGWTVIDLHGPMNAELAQRRAQDANFTFSRDRIHPDAAGHWIFTREILRGLNQPTEDFTVEPGFKELLPLVHEHVRTLGDAWLTEIGHRRPGVTKGLPLAEAREKAAKIEEQIRALVTKGKLQP
jgi:lysophospholipase L1-like esterase